MSEFEKMWQRGDFDHLPEKRAADLLAAHNRLVMKLVRAYLVVEWWGVLVRVLPTAGARARARIAISRYEAIKRQIEGPRRSDPVANINAGLHRYRVTYGTKTW